MRLILLQTRLVLGNLAMWTHGACIVYASESFDPKAIVDAVVGDNCTALHGVPTHFLGVLAELDKRQAAGECLDLSNLRYGISPCCVSYNQNTVILERELLEGPRSPLS